MCLIHDRYKKNGSEKKENISKFHHHLHRIPVTAFTEKKTAAYITTNLKQEKVAVQMSITMWKRYSFISREIKRVLLLPWDFSREGNVPLHAPKLDFNEDV